MNRNTLSTLLALTLLALLMISPAAVWAEEAPTDNGKGVSAIPPGTGFAEGENDPLHQLAVIENRSKLKKGVFFSPIQGFRDSVSAWREQMYQSTGLKIGFSFHTVGQVATDVKSGADDSAWATDFDIVGSWALVNRGSPTQGELAFGIESRWDYGTIGPQNIGFSSIGSAGGTANSFSAYNDPAVILRNFYWRQGSQEAGWAYRVGKITPDALLMTSRHLTPNTTFLPNAGNGFFTASLPDSGLGIVGVKYFADKAYIAGLISDANADRATFGDIGAGDFYKAIEVGFKPFPLTDNASFWKAMVWHTDGTKDGTPINGNTGSDGWGYALLAQQEFSSDGSLVGLARWGQSYDNASVLDRQAGLHLVKYQPFGWFENDALGVAVNWIDSVVPGARYEKDFELFYRFPLLPDLETTLHYQYIDSPAFTPGIDNSHVFSLRFTTSF